MVITDPRSPITNFRHLGPIDIGADRLPENGLARRGPRALRARDGAVDPLARLAPVGHRQRIFPPEPMRYVGARIIREALIRRDDALDAGRRPSWFLRAVARLPGLLGYRFEH